MSYFWTWIACFSFFIYIRICSLSICCALLWSVFLQNFEEMQYSGTSFIWSSEFRAPLSTGQPFRKEQPFYYVIMTSFCLWCENGCSNYKTNYTSFLLYYFGMTQQTLYMHALLYDLHYYIVWGVLYCISTCMFGLDLKQWWSNSELWAISELRAPLGPTLPG